MPLSWIIKSIPRSLSSFLVLLVVLGGLAVTLAGIAKLFDPFTSSNSSIMLQVAVGLGITVPAFAAYLYLRHREDSRRHKRSLPVAAESVHEQLERIYRQSIHTSRPVSKPKPIDRPKQ